MNTTSAAMHPASANTSACTGDGPAVLSPSIVMEVVAETAWNLRSPSQVRSATTGGLATATALELAGRAVLRDAGRSWPLRPGGAGTQRRQASQDEPARRQQHEHVCQHVTERAVRPPRLRRFVNRAAVGAEETLF